MPLKLASFAEAKRCYCKSSTYTEHPRMYGV